MMEQLPWDGVFSDSALAVFDDRLLSRDLGLSGLFPEPRGSSGSSPSIEPIYTADFSVDHASPFGHHHHHQFAFSDTRSTYLTPPPNMIGGSPSLMPPPPLPFKVQQYRQEHRQQRRRRSSGVESCESNTERPVSSSSSSIPATPPAHHQQQQQQQQQPPTSVAGSPGSSYQSRQYPSPRSPDGHPTHQSPEEFQCAVQRQDSSTSEASDTLFKDWMHVSYKPLKLPSAFAEDDDQDDNDDNRSDADEEEKNSYGGSVDSPASSDYTVDSTKGNRRELYGTGEFLQWGSDANFGTVKQHYTPSPLKESVESMHEFQVQTLKCLQMSMQNELAAAAAAEAGDGWSDEISEAPKLRTNPTANRKVVLRTQTASMVPDNDDKNDDDNDDDDGAARGFRYKRRRIELDNVKPKAEEIEATAAASPTDETETTGTADVMPKPPPGARRRRRRNREAKNWPTRPVLTDEQRRQNHIKSEKKRRILINEGFDDLCMLVPSLGKGKFCKSTVLQLAGQWLETLLDGNEALEKQLAGLREGGT